MRSSQMSRATCRSSSAICAARSEIIASIAATISVYLARLFCLSHFSNLLSGAGNRRAGGRPDGRAQRQAMREPRPFAPTHGHRCGSSWPIRRWRAQILWPAVDCSVRMAGWAQSGQLDGSINISTGVEVEADFGVVAPNQARHVFRTVRFGCGAGGNDTQKSSGRDRTSEIGSRCASSVANGMAPSYWPCFIRTWAPIRAAACGSGAALPRYSATATWR